MENHIPNQMQCQKGTKKKKSWRNVSPSFFQIQLQAQNVALQSSSFLLFGGASAVLRLFPFLLPLFLLIICFLPPAGLRFLLPCCPRSPSVLSPLGRRQGKANCPDCTAEKTAKSFNTTKKHWDMLKRRIPKTEMTRTTHTTCVLPLTQNTALMEEKDVPAGRNLKGMRSG